MSPDEAKTSEYENRIVALEERIRRLEDQIAVYQLMATYGPSADSGSGDVIKGLFTADAEYISGMPGLDFHSGAEIGEMINSLQSHRDLMINGCAHIATMPVVKFSGDKAVAVCHGQLLRFQEDEFEVWRTSATRWDFDRTPDGWKIARRTNKLLNGDRGAHDLFRSALLEEGP